MSKFDELVAAFGKRDTAIRMLLARHEECARLIYETMKGLGGAIKPAPPLAQEGRLADDYMGLLDGWYQIRFRFEFDSPSTNLPASLILRLRLRLEGDQWMLKLYESAPSTPFTVTDDGIKAICEQICDQVIADLNIPPRLYGDDQPKTAEIGFGRAT